MTETGAPAQSTRHRVRLNARVPISDCLVGCTGAKIDPVAGRPHAALDITEDDGTRRLLEVVPGEEIPLRTGTLIVERIHPWDPPHPAGVTLRWVPRAPGVPAAAAPA